MTSIYDEIERVVLETARQRVAEPKPDFVSESMWRRSVAVSREILDRHERKKANKPGLIKRLQNYMAGVI